MRVVFFGTPAFAVPSLEALLGAGHDVAAVVTQPDRAQGRSRSTLVPPPVKVRALAAGLPVLQPERPRGDEFHRALAAFAPDLGVVVAYGHLLRPEILAVPRLGMVNVHGSLLPRWRGAAPIQWALLAGDATTGVAIMRMEAGLDSGGVWHDVRTPITDDDTSGTLFARLAPLGAAALLEALPRIAGGEAPVPQRIDAVTLAPKIDRATARIRWEEGAAAVSRRIRAMDPAPGAWTTLGDAEVKAFLPRVDDAPTAGAAPGTILAVDPALVIATADGALRLDEVQPAGRRRMRAGDWARGGGVLVGDRFA